jgi:hypothetical protein
MMGLRFVWPSVNGTVLPTDCHPGDVDRRPISGNALPIVAGDIGPLLGMV